MYIIKENSHEAVVFTSIHGPLEYKSVSSCFEKLKEIKPGRDFYRNDTLLIYLLNKEEQTIVHCILLISFSTLVIYHTPCHYILTNHMLVVRIQILRAVVYFSLQLWPCRSRSRLVLYYWPLLYESKNREHFDLTLTF